MLIKSHGQTQLTYIEDSWSVSSSLVEIQRERSSLRNFKYRSFMTTPLYYTCIEKQVFPHFPCTYNHCHSECHPGHTGRRNSSQDGKGQKCLLWNYYEMHGTVSWTCCPPSKETRSWRKRIYNPHVIISSPHSAPCMTYILLACTLWKPSLNLINIALLFVSSVAGIINPFATHEFTPCC